MSDQPPHKTPDRRTFLRNASAGLVAAGALLQQACGTDAQAQDTPKGASVANKVTIKANYRTLGKTGLKVSKIGVGTGSLRSPQVLERALDLGLNYIDTAHCYMSGDSERTIGKILKRRRKDAIVTTKWHPDAKAKRGAMLKSLDESLKRLGTDHVDCVLVHSVGEKARIQNPEVFEAFEIAKKAGKVSHLGMSSHSPNMIEVLEEAIRLKRYELVLLKYSYMSYPGVGKVIDKLHKANIGVTVMKTRDGARHAKLAKYQRDDGFVASALRWASSNPKIASTVISAETFADIELFGKVAGQAVSQRDLDMLEEYAQEFANVQCRWCGDCGGACPHGVPVWEVDRAAMYYDRYQHERRGMSLYASLGQPASACASCDAPCESACSYKLPIRDQMRDAHRMLGGPLGEHFDLG